MGSHDRGYPPTMGPVSESEVISTVSHGSPNGRSRNVTFKVGNHQPETAIRPPPTVVPELIFEEYGNLKGKARAGACSRKRGQIIVAVQKIKSEIFIIAFSFGQFFVTRALALSRRMDAFFAI